jgi:hypothetical protein
VASWLRAAGISTDWSDYYYFIAATGRKAESIATRLLILLLQRLSGGDRILLALDDNIGTWHLSLWMHTLVELWAWNQPKDMPCDRSAQQSPGVAVRVGRLRERLAPSAGQFGVDPSPAARPRRSSTVLGRWSAMEGTPKVATGCSRKSPALKWSAISLSRRCLSSVSLPQASARNDSRFAVDSLSTASQRIASMSFGPVSIAECLSDCALPHNNA